MSSMKSRRPSTDNTDGKTFFAGAIDRATDSTNDLFVEDVLPDGTTDAMAPDGVVEGSLSGGVARKFLRVGAADRVLPGSPATDVLADDIMDELISGVIASEFIVNEFISVLVFNVAGLCDTALTLLLGAFSSTSPHPAPALGSRNCKVWWERSR